MSTRRRGPSTAVRINACMHGTDFLDHTPTVQKWQLHSSLGHSVAGSRLGGIRRTGLVTRVAPHENVVSQPNEPRKGDHTNEA